jgi:hypothetical protein
MDEARLIEKLKAIEALFAGATTPGERVAADAARLRILERLKSFEVADPPVEYKFTMRDMWSRRVLVALLRRYDLKPYRYRGQRHTTVMVKVSKQFVEETLWPQFQEISETLRTYLSEVTDRVVSQVLSEDLSEAVEVGEQQALPITTADSPTPIRPADPTGGDGTQASDGVSSGPGLGGHGDPRPNRHKRKKKKKKRRR